MVDQLASAERLWHPAALEWPEVDPAVHPFDPAQAAMIVARLAAKTPLPNDWRDEVAERWLREVTGGLVREYGIWAAGWRWAVGEGTYDGGPVRSWCCTTHSVTTADETLDRIVMALVEWRAWLEHLSDLFNRLLPDAATVALTDDEFVWRWERAVAKLVTVVADQTGAESGWYTHCRQVLRWSLTAAGIPADQAQDLVIRATQGRFHSWAEPADSDVSAMAADVAARLERTVHG